MDDDDELTMKVRVVAHRDFIVCVPREPEKHIGRQWMPTGAYGPERRHLRIGCVACDSKRMLGVSKEALGLMARIRVGRHAIGDLSWFRANDGRRCFSWLGALYRLVHVPTCEAARHFSIHRDACTIIPNDVPAEAKAVIRAVGGLLEDERTCWKDPAEIEYTDEDLKNMTRSEQP